MSDSSRPADAVPFLKSLGFPEFRIHHPFNHFDFTRAGRRILVIGPMGSGKTEYSTRVWRDSRVVLRKSGALSRETTRAGADRRNVFVVRLQIDDRKFSDYPDDALPFRGGYERCGPNIARITSSFELERLIEANPSHGTWIIDEATFYDERLAYVVERESQSRGLVFVFPTLLLNFRRELFNPTARLLLDVCTDVFPLTAYCEHDRCIRDSFYTYRYYTVGGRECPALYFDPLIIIGGDAEREDAQEPNYCTRCDAHHYLPGKEYAYLVLKPLGEQAARGDSRALERELRLINARSDDSELARDLRSRYADEADVNRNALHVDCIAERALLYLFVELNLVSSDEVARLSRRLDLDRAYMNRRLADNRRAGVDEAPR